MFMVARWKWIWSHHKLHFKVVILCCCFFFLVLLIKSRSINIILYANDVEQVLQQRKFRIHVFLSIVLKTIQKRVTTYDDKNHSIRLFALARLLRQLILQMVAVTRPEKISASNTKMINLRRNFYGGSMQKVLNSLP